MRPTTPSNVSASPASRLSLPRRAALGAVALAALAACGGGGGGSGGGDGSPAARVGDTLALTASGRIVSFDRAAPAVLASSRTVVGLDPTERLVGIDIRPADGAVYAVSSRGRIFTLDPATGALALRSTISVALAGNRFGMDFNPVADRLRLVSDTGQNLRIDVATGTAVVDGAVNGPAGGAAARITGSAYTNSFAGATTTQLYNLDAAGTLTLQDPPNNGTQAAPVALGLRFSDDNGFDIDARSNRAYAALTVDGATRLYTVPLTGTAGATLVGTVGDGEALTGLALVQPPAARAYALTADGRLARFSPATPNQIDATVAIAGLAAGESVLGIDFRPANGRLYALMSTGRLLTVDPDTGGTASPVALAADPADATQPYAGLAGSRFTVDFNPAADRLRVISDAGQNLRINADTGATTTDGAINRAVPAQVVAGAYTNSFAGATATELFNLDAAASVLTRQAPPNDGTQVDVGPLGVALGGQGALDIAGGANGLVLAALRSGATGPFSLYTVALGTGAATLYRNTSGDASQSFIGGANGPAVRDIAIRY